MPLFSFMHVSSARFAQAFVQTASGEKRGKFVQTLVSWVNWWRPIWIFYNERNWGTRTEVTLNRFDSANIGVVRRVCVCVFRSIHAPTPIHPHIPVNNMFERPSCRAFDSLTHTHAHAHTVNYTDILHPTLHAANCSTLSLCVCPQLGHMVRFYNYTFSCSVCGVCMTLHRK